MMAMGDIQEILALAVVAVVVALAVWRSWRRRSRSRAASNNPKEATLRFYRRRP